MEIFLENNERKVYCSIKDFMKIRCVVYCKVDLMEVIDGKYDVICEVDIMYENDYLVFIDEISD